MSDYGPNVIIPTATEADQMEHDNSQCSFGDLCEACRRQIKRNR
jgi:hypothetical protein